MLDVIGRIFGDFVIKFLIIGVAIGVIWFLFFYWLNRKENRLEDRSYDEDFEAGDMVSPYKYHRIDKEDLVEPEKELGAYKVRRKPKHK